MMANWCKPVAAGIRISIRVAPNAKSTQVAGIDGDALKIRLRAQAIEGRANAALIDYLAGVLSLPKSAIVLLHGHAARHKVVEIHGPHLNADEIEQMLLPVQIKK